MTFFGNATTSTRRVAPSHRPWIPLPYMERASEFLTERGAAMLWLDPGMRKTSITLDAFVRLQEAGAAKKLLVVAPLKVCQLVWRQEAAKWSQFRHLRFSLVHGPKKKERLREDADVYLINPEGAAWLAAQYKLSPATFPFDTVVIDEITKFKNSQAERSKALRPVLKHVRRRWGLTGTPSPNGYMDLFGQFLMIDDGAALGRYITHFRDLYFTADYNGFDYVLQPGAERRMEKKLEPYVFRLDGDDYLTLPPIVDNVISIQLEPAARKVYDAMRLQMVAELPGGVVDAANKAAAYSKMKQMAGGAVYLEDGSVEHIHDAKLEALYDLVDELGGQQLLIGYEFNHEMERLRASRLGNRITFMSDAKTDVQVQAVQDRWNRGEIEILACHPASAGHGLNLQEGHAGHLCWFAPIWDLELWDQFIRRLRRSGNEAARIMRHVLVVLDSIDELALLAIEEKDITQTRLLRSLQTLLGGVETLDAGDAATRDRRDDMVAKLSRGGAAAATTGGAPKGWGGQAAAAEEQAPAAAPAAEEGTRPAPKGWGLASNLREVIDEDKGSTQRERIQEKLTGAAPAEEDAPVKSAFSDNVTQLRQAVEQGDDAPFEAGTIAVETAPKRTRKAAAEPAAGNSAAQYVPSPQEILVNRIFAFKALAETAVALSAPDVPEALFDPMSDKLLELVAAL